MRSRSLLPFVSSLLLLVTLSALRSNADPIHPLAQNPALGTDIIAFRFADDLWSVPREGGEARRLTATSAVSDGPFLSPDGRWLAYSARYDDNLDVFIIPSGGGEPRRLTYHPGPDVAVGWSPDSQSVLFLTLRDVRRDLSRLYKANIDGKGLPQPVPLPASAAGAFSPDSSRIAYVPYVQWQRAWKRYRGGQTTPIWIADLKTMQVDKIPRDNSNDNLPVWVGDKVYFLSDRNGPVSLFAYDTASKQVEPVVENHGFDFKSFSAGPGGLVYEQFGDLHLYDLKTHAEHPVTITISNDLPELRPHLIHPDPKSIENVGLSPSGERLAVEARGDIFTIPREKGDVRNLTHSADAADRDPSWSPDGKYVAYFSDKSGEYALYLANQNGLGETKKIDLGQPPSYFYSPVWSPDSKHISYADKRLNLWYVNVDGGAPVKIDTDYFETPSRDLRTNWSPDSKWIVYSKGLSNHLHAICVYSLATGKSQQITDGMSDALHTAFDRNGKYIYFTASTNAGPAEAWLDLSSADRPESSAVYVAVLSKDEPSPLKPESDEEKVKGEGDTKTDTKSDDDKKDTKTADKKDQKKDENKDDKKDDKTEKVPVVKIDFDGIEQRILALPMPERHYVDLQAGKEGVIFVAEGSPVNSPVSPAEDNGITLHRLVLKDRKEQEVLHGISGYTVSADGSRIAYQKGPGLSIAGDDELKPEAASPGKPLNVGGMLAMSDPRAEWRQMYHETWRIERDFFYDPHYHGLDLKVTEAKYAPYLDRLGSRSALNVVFEEMLGNMTVGHMFIGGPPTPDPSVPPPGLLGADYDTANGRYRFRKVYNGENWNPDLNAPLTQPGVNVREGEYLFAVNGRDLHATDNLFSLFDGTMGQQTVLRVGDKPDGSNARDVTVVPIKSEEGLRTRAWIEDNRRRVDQLTNGRVGYVYLPDTAGGGYTYFNRYYYAQLGKEGVVLDERFNHGGYLADYIIDALRRPLEAYNIPRDGHVETEPVGSIFGPKVMIINQSAGSGGDAMPWLFRKESVGQLVGTRTWGGLVGIGGYPVLLDGGRVTAPRVGIFGTSGVFEVENHGVKPDIEVEMFPGPSTSGDPQLERAVDEVMRELKEHPVPTPPRPGFPDYHQQEKQ